jgi:dTDP-glucose 4,6-dehydratase
MRIRDGRAIPNFLAQALRGEPLTVYGDGSQTRSFGYISDLVRGVMALADSDQHEPVNLGNPTEMTVVALARKILELTGSTSEIAFRPLPVDDPQVRRPDISLARKTLGWWPEVDVDTGLRTTVEDFKRRLKVGDRSISAPYVAPVAAESRAGYCAERWQIRRYS